MIKILIRSNRKFLFEANHLPFMKLLLQPLSLILLGREG